MKNNLEPILAVLSEAPPTHLKVFCQETSTKKPILSVLSVLL
jgi:hypothetical protein